MMARMPIRMREWGMLRAPENNTRVPVGGLSGWAQVASQLGTGIRDLAETGTQMAEERREVQKVADQAKLAARLQEVNDEAQQQLRDEQPRDWAYAWRQASAPGIAEAVSELPEEQRAAGRAMADWLSARASLEAQRDHELSRIEDSRRSWQQRLDEAVASGDEQKAGQWLEAGRRVFVPEAEMEQRGAEVASRCCLSRWQQRLAESPARALGDLAEAAPEAWPGVETDRLRLQEQAVQTRKGMRRELAQGLADDLRRGQRRDADRLQEMQRAGLISAEQLAEARKPVVAAGPATLSAWMRRVDECPDDEEARTELSLSIETSPLEASRRRELLERLNDGAALSAADRSCLSRSLYDWYGRGCFGCAADVQSQRTYLRLQREGFSLLRREGSEAAAEWLEKQRESAGRWVCFEFQQNWV